MNADGNEQNIFQHQMAMHKSLNWQSGSVLDLVLAEVTGDFISIDRRY